MVPRPAGRSVHGHLRPWHVVDKVGKSVGRVGVPACCCLVYVCVVVEIARYVNHVLNDRSRVRVSIKAVGAAGQAVVDPVRVGGSVARYHLAKRAVVVERLGAAAVLSVPVENNIAPAVGRGVRTYRDEFAYGAYCYAVTVHAGDGHIEIFPGVFVEGNGLEQRRVGLESDEPFSPERLVRSVGFRHACARKARGPGGPVRERRLGDTAIAGWEVVATLEGGLPWLWLPRA